jgi:deoxycytidylate deaminase
MNPPADENSAGYVDEMQNIGNSLRRKFGGDYLIEKTIEKIVRYRKEKRGISPAEPARPERRAFIVDSLKNTEELDLLKQVYGETLCTIGIFAPDEIRQNRLRDKGFDPASIEKITSRDQGEVDTFGQKTRKIFVNADFFVCNDARPEELKAKVARFLDILFDTSIRTPTRAESAMYEASSASLNSACMSRQVGAAIVSDAGELIAVGWNDVPRFGGGLYCEDDNSIYDETRKKIGDNDKRCFKWGGKICHNEVKRNKILDKISERIAAGTVLKKGSGFSDVRALLEGTDVDNLIEFSRSIHAEMEAILSVAREGRKSLSRATLYTSTYPCHNCARHIVASGIHEVIYIEPYLKSLAIELHNDAISENPDDRGSKVVFRQYDGVAPSKFMKLFKSGSPRKQEGHLSRRDRRMAFPLFRQLLDALTEYEAKVIADLTKKEQH